MARLTDLANEILLHIVSYLEPELEDHFGPFYRWRQVLERQVHNARVRAQTVNALALSCKRFHGLLTPVLYSYIPLTDENRYSKSLLPRLLEAFEANESLGGHVYCAAVVGFDAFEFQTLFWLPNVHSLSIQSFNGWEPLEWDDEDHVGTSPVRTLRLSNCGAHEEPLKEILSWPFALEELWYEAQQGEWEGHYEGQDPVGFTSAAIERCLASQADSLKKLVYSREVQCHEGLGYSDVIDLTKFRKLESLSINHVFLVGSYQDTNVWERLPSSLVELDVFYDDWDYHSFMHYDAARPQWLFDLLEKKPEFLPALERVRILSLEWTPDVETEDSEGFITLDGSWNPGRELVQAFARAEVSFSLCLHEDRRFKYIANGKGWEDNWEAEIDSHLENL